MLVAFALVSFALPLPNVSLFLPFMARRRFRRSGIVADSVVILAKNTAFECCTVDSKARLGLPYPFSTPNQKPLLEKGSLSACRPR
jgi:hypothetical protein